MILPILLFLSIPLHAEFTPLPASTPESTNSNFKTIDEEIRRLDSVISSTYGVVGVLNGTNIWTGGNNWVSNSTFTSITATTVTASEIQADRVCMGDPTTGSVLNTGGAGCIWARSIDNVTQASGCVVAVVITSTGTEGVAVVTSTTTYIDVSAKTPGVFLESCSPGSICRVGIRGIFRVYYDYNTGSGYLCSAARCNVSDTVAFDGIAIGYQSGPRLGTSGYVWMRFR